MFDFLKKKFTDFVSKVTGREESKEEAAPAPEELEVETEERPEKKIEAAKPEKERKAEAKPPAVKKPETKAREKPVVPKPEPKPQIKEKAKAEVEQKVELKKEEGPGPEVKAPKVSLSIATAVKSFITREVEIKEEDVKPTLESLELELLEGDVAMDVAEGIAADLRKRLVGSRVEKGKIHDFIKRQMIEVLKDSMTTGKEFDFIEAVGGKEKPVKILFLGINGSGKTTTIAKIAHMLMKNGYSVVLAGADTFRAAAIEQISIHADRLGVKVIKRDYGSDPTSVAFDAVSYAKAHGIDAVLIDTAGRQETNINLMNELKKIERVIKPDIKLYVGESIGGSAVIEQVASFNSEIGIDGIVLTKLDCDAKGGTVISAAKASGVPVVLIGTGQKYDDIEPFVPAKIIERLMG